MRETGTRRSRKGGLPQARAKDRPGIFAVPFSVLAGVAPLTVAARVSLTAVGDLRGNL